MRTAIDTGEMEAAKAREWVEIGSRVKDHPGTEIPEQTISLDQKRFATCF